MSNDDTTPEAPASPPGIFDLDPPPDIDPSRFGPVPVVSFDDEESNPGEPSTELPHWTAPATGQVPKVVATSSEEWSDLSGPRWHGEGPAWGDDDLSEVLGGAESRTRIVIDDEADELSPALAQPSAGDPQRQAQAQRARSAKRTPAPSVERNIPQAIGVGLAVAVVALIAFRISGNAVALGLITVVATVAAIEVFASMRLANIQPATLLGIVACATFPLVVYHRGDAGFALVMALSVVFGALWYIVGADSSRPALNLGLTFLGISWVGVLAGFAGLILRMNDGKSILVAAIICTAVYDTGALAGGMTLGKSGHAFHPMSPSKTWEGTIVGLVAAVIAGLVIGIYGISPFSEELLHAIYLGLLAGVLGPIGDLAQSMIKRDLGVKDMGTILPGHGGVMDRIDGLLFVLPGTYYLALLLGFS